MPDIEEWFYEIAAREVAEKKFNPGMMAKAFSEADGDEKKAIARYIKYRVEQLGGEYRAEQARRQEEQIRQREAEAQTRRAVTDGNVEQINQGLCCENIWLVVVLVLGYLAIAAGILLAIT